MSNVGDTATNRFRVMRVIARMNIGGPAIQISGLCRHLDPTTFDHRLYTGFCAVDEADRVILRMHLEIRAIDCSLITLSKKFQIPRVCISIVIQT